MVIDAQVPDLVIDEKEYFHVSKKKRNAPNALNKKRKNNLLYENIIEFDYELLKTIEQEEEEEFEKNKREQKPWTMLIGRVRLNSID
jgi:glutaredoxin